jgi:hypothetical protein
MDRTLSVTEVDRLGQCESVLEKGLQTFIEVGNALLEIRDSRLYRQEFKTFEEYLKERWNMSRAYAHRIIEASQFSALLPIGNKPTSEGQARAMIADVVKKAAAQAQVDNGTFEIESIPQITQPIDHRWIEFIGPIIRISEQADFDPIFIASSDDEQSIQRNVAACERVIKMAQSFIKEAKRQYPNVFT